ncbi:NUDIX hydrolase [Sediminibacillus massiliensis]|uniref:NUDIX hydrolase n=1 Tax=Sediminibacillus massiliensis TaxID=1926277 RepID=UPI00098844B9|nr:CoA pyrophosphatase [Sediminibacillus massiliensis]
MDANTILKKIENRTPSVLGHEQFAKFAVLIPMIEKDGELHLLLEVRSQNLRRQPGDICFPGGKIDKQDKSPKAAAIRETSEELGIDESEIIDVLPIDYMVSAFGMMVFPYVGMLKESQDLQPNPDEVGETFTVPLNFFLETEPKVYQVNLEVQPEENFPHDLIAGGEDYDWRPLKMEEHFYLYENRVIWGMTAKIISHFVQMIRE